MGDATDLGRSRGHLRPWLTVWLGLCLSCGGSSADSLNSTSDGGPVEVPPWACVPGETQPCDCPDEDLDGLQTCGADGAGFGSCDCSPGAVSQGPPPTSTGTGSGTASDSGNDDTATTGASGSSGPGPMTTEDPTTGPGPGTTMGPDPTTGGGTSSGGGGTTGTTG